MTKLLKILIRDCVFVVAMVFLSFIQPTNAPAVDTNSIAASPAPADLAPDVVLQKLRDLIDAGKYPEAQQMATGLLAAYPDDSRLVKAKALLDKLVAQQSVPAVPAVSQPRTTVTPAKSPPAISPADQLIGMDKVEYNSLIELGREAQETADLDAQKQLLRQFMQQSWPFLKKHPKETLVWQLMAEAALMLNDADTGYQAGQHLLVSPNADNNPTTQELLSRLNIKGWLDKQEVAAQDYAKYGWVFGTWNVSRSLDPKISPRINYPDMFPGNDLPVASRVAERNSIGETEQFVQSGNLVEGYQITRKGVKSTFPDLRGKITKTGVVSWECYLPTNMTFGIYVFRTSFWGSQQGRTKVAETYYPQGWVPVNSCTVNDDRTVLTIVIPMQWTSASLGVPENKNVNAITLTFTRGNVQNQPAPTSQSQLQGALFNSLQGGK